MNKKGIVQFIPLLLTPIGAIIIGLFALVLAIFFGGAALLTYILTMNVWRIGGILLLLLAVLHYIGKVRLPERLAMAAVILGAILVFLPFVGDTFNLPLAAVLSE